MRHTKRRKKKKKPSTHPEDQAIIRRLSYDSDIGMVIGKNILNNYDSYAKGIKENVHIF